ncbi:EAL domain-containing protein [Effusibacillus pohliae]|uniref:EAL domain-containing protein n=1 Tax=Effusibacillus pohliae TaxID=232270 RepID=UPI000360511F|nr:EAL domain-containing protein [Effusibacillus pohliae]
MNGDRWSTIELFPLYQRIVPLTEPQTNFAFEALIRGRTRSGKCLLPSALFDQSEEQQILLDFKARDIAIKKARAIIQNALLFLNCHPRALQTGAIFEDITKLELPLQQLVLEITEQTHIDDLKSLKRELSVLRKHGVKIALDDFGTGFSNFWLVEALQPEFIKLDRSIIVSLETSKQARRVIAGLVAFAEKVKTQLIAEGVEREKQRVILVELGIPYGQGFLLGHPFALSKGTIL